MPRRTEPLTGAAARLGSKPERREITTYFAGAALLLLGGAMVSSLRLGGRLP